MITKHSSASTYETLLSVCVSIRFGLRIPSASAFSMSSRSGIVGGDTIYPTGIRAAMTHSRSLIKGPGRLKKELSPCLRSCDSSAVEATIAYRRYEATLGDEIRRKSDAPDLERSLRLDLMEPRDWCLASLAGRRDLRHTNVSSRFGQLRKGRNSDSEELSVLDQSYCGLHGEIQIDENFRVRAVCKPQWR